jgi:hypothetical protein
VAAVELPTTITRGGLTDVLRDDIFTIVSGANGVHHLGGSATPFNGTPPAAASPASRTGVIAVDSPQRPPLDLARSRAATRTRTQWSDARVKRRPPCDPRWMCGGGHFCGNARGT